MNKVCFSCFVGTTNATQKHDYQWLTMIISNRVHTEMRENTIAIRVRWGVEMIYCYFITENVNELGRFFPTRCV